MPVSITDGGDRPWLRRVIALLRRAPLRWRLLAAGGLAVGVSGLFGGLHPVPRPELPRIGEDQRYAGQPWTVTVNGAGTLTDATAFRLKPQTAGDRWLVLSVTIEVTADESRADLDAAVRLRPVPGLRTAKPARTVLRRDAPSPASDLHPGLPEEIYLFWELAGDARPAEVEVEVVGMTFRADSLTGHMRWTDAKPRAVVRAAVKDLDAAL